MFKQNERQQPGPEGQPMGEERIAIPTAAEAGGAAAPAPAAPSALGAGGLGARELPGGLLYQGAAGASRMGGGTAMSAGRKQEIKAALRRGLQRGRQSGELEGLAVQARQAAAQEGGAGAPPPAAEAQGAGAAAAGLGAAGALAGAAAAGAAAGGNGAPPPDQAFAGQGADLGQAAAGPGYVPLPGEEGAAPRVPGRLERWGMTQGDSWKPTKRGLGTLGAVAIAAFLLTIPAWIPRGNGGTLALSGGKNVTGHDDEPMNPLQGARLTGPDQPVSVSMNYATLDALSSFIGNFSGEVFTVNASHTNGSLTVPFSSLAEANNAFDATQILGQGSQEGDLHLKVHALDAKNHSTASIDGYAHYVPGPAPTPPIVISGAQNGSIGPGETYAPFTDFAAQNLGQTEANSAHFSMVLDTKGDTSCNLSSSAGELIVSVNSQYPTKVATLDFQGVSDLVLTMKGVKAGCEGDNATFYSEIFDTAGTRNASNTLSSTGTYTVPPAPPAPGCDYVTAVPVSYTTLSNVVFNPFETQQPQLTASSSGATGKFGYYYSAPPVYTGFDDMGCAPQFGVSSFSNNNRYCLTVSGGLNTAQAEQLFKQGIPLKLLAGARKGTEDPVGLIYQPDQAGCPQNQTGLVAVIYPALSQVEADKANRETAIKANAEIAPA